MAFSIEELIIDDSFISYCTHLNPDDLARWDEYLIHHPQELETIDQAKRIVLSLKFMLKEKQNELSADENYSENHLVLQKTKNEESPNLNFKSGNSNRFRWIAAAVLILVAGTIIFWFNQNNLEPISNNIADNSIPNPKLVSTHNGQIKEIWLKDSTKVIINAGSHLKIDEGFGSKNRTVYLTGEALFEVKHNTSLPFIVTVSKYKVKAIGTKFNVKAYKGENHSETALLEGKVQILVNNGKKENVVKTLEVNQKFILEEKADKKTHLPLEHATIVPLRNIDLPTKAEIAWVENYLIFDDQPLSEIVAEIERRFNLQISIADAGVGNYKYTANFKNESVDEIFRALQLSYPFTYTKNENKIIIKK